MTELEGGHASGKWSKTKTPAFHRDVRWMRGGRRLWVTRTEATSLAFNAAASWPGDGWGLYHVRNGVGEDCSVEWDLARASKVEASVVQLTDFRVTTTGGVKNQPVALTRVVLKIPEAGDLEVEVGVTHLDLANTAPRRAANLEECHALRAHYVTEHKRHPRRHFVLNFDGNRDQRSPRWRAYFERELFAGTPLRSLWASVHPLPAHGTHGKRAILDIAASSLPGTAFLLRDDPASDHRPIGERLRVS